MFTGIVEELGTVVSMENHGDAARLTVQGSRVAGDLKYGDSVAVNGCCLTVTECDGTTFTADVMRETLQRTSLAQVAAGSPVNLERPVTTDARLGGHIVQGHVDGVGSITERTPGEHWEIVRIAIPDDLSRYVAVKGSIAVDGISLTVVDVHDRPPGFTVGLIPTTLRLTTLGRKAVGDPVNLEVDVLAKYVERLLSAREAT
ncbi:MAG: riboflavin synthase [Propionibacteriales bacterium]|nr:riboflavin synthase [Propionibacteriales bacterium]